MKLIVVRGGDAADIEAFLADRIHEFNAAATGYHDAESFALVLENGGELEAGISGYTWGGCCFVAGAAERHAREKRCEVVLLASHSFQAPEFYARRGYERASSTRSA